VNWYVCNPDDGVLRVEGTRREALAWLMRRECAPRVLSRYTYGPGYYSYIVGQNVEDRSQSMSLVREDCLRWYGIDTAPEEIQPLYPKADDD
jgi:hypothetical protein